MEPPEHPPLTDERIRSIYREYASLVANIPLAAISFAMAGLTPPEPVAEDDEAHAERAERALATMEPDRMRIQSIATVIALLGLDEAREQVGPLSERAAKEWHELQNKKWRYSVWDHRILLSLIPARQGRIPILREEVDAVARVIQEIRLLDPMLHMGLASAARQGDILRADPDSRTRPAAEKPRNIEARKFLARRRSTAILAGNRFGTNKGGIDFVEELYAAGAAKVMIPADTVQDDGPEGHLHSDTLIVTLPKDPEARARVFAISSREARREGFDEERDEGQKDLLFWWD